MPYLYTLLGITAWVAITALSSNALVTYENGKQAENIKRVIARTKEEVSNIKVLTTPAAGSSAQETSGKTTTETLIVKPTTVKTVPAQKPSPRQREEDDDD